MLSRIADSLFWLNRYMERSDALVRSTKVNYILMLDKGINQDLNWQTVLNVFTTISTEEKEVLKNDTEKALFKLLLDSNNPNSLKTMVGKARENARGVQDHITKEVWENVNQLYHNVNSIQVDTAMNSTNIMPILNELELACLLYNGVADTTMPRGLGWNFMNLGRYIERTILTIDICNSSFHNIQYNLSDEKDILQWRPLLLALSGYELHLKTYRSDNYNLNVLDQVLFNKNFTRSVIYTLKRIKKYYSSTIDDMTEMETMALTKQLGRLISKVEFADADELHDEMLKSFLFSIRGDLIAFSNNLAQQFFSYH